MPPVKTPVRKKITNAEIKANIAKLKAAAYKFKEPSEAYVPPPPVVKKPEPILEEIGATSAYYTHNYHHNQVIVKHQKTGNSIRMSTCITGCGLGQVRGVVDFVSYPEGTEALKECMEVLANRLRKYGSLGVGCVFATLGDNYYHMHDNLLAAGFEFVKEYRNYAHAAPGSQRCYVYEIKELKK